MGTFAGTAIVDYHLLFADQGKQTSIFRFCLQLIDGSLPIPVSICIKQTEVPFSVILFCICSRCLALFYPSLVPSIPAPEYSGNRLRQPYAKLESGTNLVMYDVYYSL